MGRFKKLAGAVVLASLVCGAVGVADEITTTPESRGDLFDRAPYTFSFGLGRMFFEGDEEVENGNFLSLKLGRDFNPRFALEGMLGIAPSLDNRKFDDGRFALSNEIWAVRLGLDGLFHLRNTDDLHFDPYLTVGAAIMFWEESLGAGTEEFLVTAGGGMFYHLNDEWAIRADARTELVGADTEAKVLATIAGTWRWGAHVPREYALLGGDIDSDGDGLLDEEEINLGTDPYDPDTDKDGLLDGPEVKQYGTDPLNPDTDLDALKDGAEVLTYATDPLDRDTDDGGVADGHEVIEDNTDPLDPSDDLQLFTLNIEFDYNKADIRPEYYSDLDVVVRVLQRDPTATARIEGHADKRPKSSKKYNQKLSEKRAKAVLDYIADVGGIGRPRLESEGYGFDRPLVPNDSEINMQRNRRTEVYIRSDGKESAAGGEMPRMK